MAELLMTAKNDTQKSETNPGGNPGKYPNKKRARLASVAFVESPLQFLSALESHEPTEDLLIRARANAKGMTSFLDAFDPAWLPKNVRLEREGAKPGVLHKADFNRIYLGDACSDRKSTRLNSSHVAISYA